MRTSQDNAKHNLVVDQLNRLNDSSPGSLTFPPILEQGFEHAYRLWYRDNIKIGTLLGALLLSTEGVVDWVGQGYVLDPFTLAARIITIGVLLLTFLYVKRSSSGAYQDLLVFLNALLATGLLLLLSQHYTAPFEQIYHVGVVLVEIVFFNLFRMRFRHAVLCAVMLISMNSYALYLTHDTLKEYIFIEFVVLAGTVIALIVCYVIEKTSRENYLQSQLISMERDFLLSANLQLQEELTLDSLTQVANKVSFDSALLDGWNEAFREHASLGLLIIGVDSINRFNKRHGSDMGDDLLRSVARCISSQVEQDNGLVARIGGTQFAVLLHRMEEAEVVRRGEKFSQAVKNLSLFDGLRLSSENVTFSVAAGSMRPSPESDPRDFLASVMKNMKSDLDMGGAGNGGS